MTKVQRFNSFLIGILMIAFGVIIFIEPELGLSMIYATLCIALIVMGVNKLIFYYRMARHMVGGRNSLIVGLLLLDLGIYAFMLQEFPKAYLIIYMLAIHAFSGVVDILSALDAIRTSSKNWRIRMFSGVVNLTMAVCAVFYGFAKGDMRLVVYIFAMGICYSGLMRMINAFRRTAVAYIQ